MSGLQGSPVLDPELGSGLSRPSPSGCRLPRRYVLALMCNSAFFIKAWMLTNMSMIFYHLFVFAAEEDERLHHMPTIANFTMKESDNILVSSHSAYIVGQIPAAMLIIMFSPYKILQLSMLLSSILQLITPWTLKISAGLFISNIIVQSVILCPLESACMGMWREWAPATEKTRLLMISFSGKLVFGHLVLPLCLFLSESVSPVSIHYFSGITGIIWCILWTCIVSDSPENDPLISKTELQLLDQQVSLQNKEKISLKSIPVKSILKSLPVLSICLVSCSTAFSSRSLIDFMYIIHAKFWSQTTEFWMLCFLVVNCIVLVPAAGVLVDFIINRRIAETTTVRKAVYSGGLLIHTFFIILLSLNEEISAYICFLIATIVFPYTLAGFLPNILDISSRYACVIMGLVMTFHSFSSLMYDFLLVYFISDWTHSEWVVALIPVECLAVVAAIFFIIFGSGEEQSFSSAPAPRDPNDSQCYPQTNLEDEMLISEEL